MPAEDPAVSQAEVWHDSCFSWGEGVFLWEGDH